MSVWQAITDALPAIVHYPDACHRQVKEVVAKRFGICENSILCGNGAMEALELTLRHVHPARIIVLHPAFGEYEAVARRHGYEVIGLSLTHDEDGYRVPFSSLHAKLAPGDMLMINNPHNPTSQVWSREDLRDHVLALCARQITVLLDESFIDFVPGDESCSLLQEAQHVKHLYVIRSATKFYAIPGLRFGFAVGRASEIEAIESDRDGWSVNTLAQAAAVAAYQDQTFATQTHDWLIREQSYIAATWGTHAQLAIESVGVNFFLVRFPDADTAMRITTGLQEVGIWLRDCSSFQGLDGAYRRVAIKTREDNERVWTHVSRLLG